MKKDGAKVLFATAIAFALIFGLATNSLKLRDQPPSWKITSERYGIGWQFRFGKSIEMSSTGCGGGCSVFVAQRNSFGPAFYERRLDGSYAGSMYLPNLPDAGRDQLFAELD